MPEFASRDYWDQRFSNDQTPFDWLLPAPAFRDLVATFVQESSVGRGSQILHVGCGTSDSFVLRSTVADPTQILNVDYSRPATEAAKAREDELLVEEEKKFLNVTASDDDDLTRTNPLKPMRWSCLDLLSIEPILEVLEQQVSQGQLFDLIIDKSTSDSISCGHDVLVNVPYVLSINGWTSQVAQSGINHKVVIHPLHVLAVHLAALTTPLTGKWVVISYSEDRFPFLPPFPANTSHGLLDDTVINAGFPHPYNLWKLEKKEPIEHEETLAERKKRLASGYVHRPQVSLWLYVLVRTDVMVTC